MWLVARNRCWTADQLARRSLQHPTTCPHYDQDEENINHLLLSCVFAREFWFSLMQRVGLLSAAPMSSNGSCLDRWDRISCEAVDLIQKGLNSLIILGAWTLWKHIAIGQASARTSGLTPALERPCVHGIPSHRWDRPTPLDFLRHSFPPRMHLGTCSC
jgi:hypothetical protein